MGHNQGQWKFNGHDAVISDCKENSTVDRPPLFEPDNDPDGLEYYGGYLICESVTEANAHLIVAAPDLLAACEKVPHLLKEIRGFACDAFGGESSLTDCIDLVLGEIEVAIAKARGKEEKDGRES